MRRKFLQRRSLRCAMRTFYHTTAPSDLTGRAEAVDSTEIPVYGRQVVAKVEFHLGERFPRVGFIVTTDSRAVVRLYNKRGTAEPWIKESKQAVKMARLARPLRVGDWSLTSLQQRWVKTGGAVFGCPRRLGGGRGGPYGRAGTLPSRNKSCWN
jgi:hypothetical protein